MKNAKKGLQPAATKAKDFTFAGMSFLERSKLVEEIRADDFETDDIYADAEAAFKVDSNYKTEFLLSHMGRIGEASYRSILFHLVAGYEQLHELHKSKKKKLEDLSVENLIRLMLRHFDQPETTVGQVEATIKDMVKKIIQEEDKLTAQHSQFVKDSDAVLLSKPHIPIPTSEDENAGLYEQERDALDEASQAEGFHSSNQLNDDYPDTDPSLAADEQEAKYREKLQKSLEDDRELTDNELYDLASDLHANSQTDAEEDENVEDFNVEDFRNVVINSLIEYESSEENAKAMRVVYSAMTTERLSETLQYLQKEWGGSAAFKHALEAAKELITASDASPETRARISVLHQKHKDYHALAQKISQVVGNDTVINQMQHTAYHETLTAVLKDYMALSAAVKHVAKLVRYPIPSADDVVESTRHTVNLESQIKSLIYVGSTARSWLVSADAIKRDLEDSRAETIKVEAELKRIRDLYEHEKARNLEITKAVQANKMASFGNRLGLALPGGGLIGLNVPLFKGVKIKREDIIITHELNKAILVESMGQLEKLEDALFIWAKKYPKSFEKLGINPSHLMHVTITIDKV
jgi:hypothetical protein